MKGYLLLGLFGCIGCIFLSSCGDGIKTEAAASTSHKPAATHLAFSTPANTTSGSVFSFTVTALDSTNNVVPGYTGTVHFTSTDTQANLPGDSTLTNGTATFSATLNTVGNETITATDTSTSSITGTSSSISVSSAAPPVATHLSVHTPANATTGSALNFRVTALDSTNNVVPGYTGTVHFTSTDNQALLPANSSLTNGVGTFAVTLNTTGNQTITATDTLTASITGTSASIHVLATASGFTPTGSMLHTRESHTATLLNNGKVLVAGGMHWAESQNCFRPPCLALTALSSAELYDPSTGGFTATENMSATRVFHTATLLSDGKVLVTGGDDRYGTTFATAELFDPATNTFTLTGNMVMARSAHTATLLPNGKVLVAGGAGPNGNVQSAELFDPATGQFTLTGNMTVARFFHTATLLNNGKVLLAGGDPLSSTAELYDPATGTFEATGNMSLARSSHRATLLQSGTVLITGGASNNGTTAAAELYQPTSGTFALTGTMSTARETHTATMLANGKVLVTGGINVTSNQYTASAELFDPVSGTFTGAGNMEIERSEHAATLLMNGVVLITGGINADNAAGLNSLASVELFP